MYEIEAVKDIAHKNLVVRTLFSQNDCYLWDRAQRLLRNVETICMLPEISNSKIPVDRFSLIVAVYFVDAGLARHLADQALGKVGLDRQISNDQLLEMSTAIVIEQFEKLLDPARIRKINHIITESAVNHSKMPEAMILADARNLDDMGMTGIFNEFRRYVTGGKGIEDVLQIWQRKIEYQYWQARLKDHFRFSDVKKLAKQRLDSAEQFMTQLKTEHTATDLQSLCKDIPS